jgi:hypothetical protein
MSGVYGTIAGALFSPPPEIISNYMEQEVEQALIEWNPLIARIIRHRGLFGSAPRVHTELDTVQRHRHESVMIRSKSHE